MNRSRLYRALLYITFLLLAGVTPAYDRERRKKQDRHLQAKEAAMPWENPEFVQEEAHR
jgi:hypothetical protein